MVGNKLTHKQLVNLGARWMKGLSIRDWRILTETGYRTENPDIFAFAKYYSVLIECKASRADFLADKKKPFRANPETGIGRRRYYLTNRGVAKQEEMPKGWQLLEAYDENTILLPRNFTMPDTGGTEGDKEYSFHVRNASAEIELMYSWLYRKEHNCLPKIEGNKVASIHSEYWEKGDDTVNDIIKNVKKYNLY